MEYRKVLNAMSAMNVRSQFPKILTVCLREDTFYGTLWVTNDNITIQQLPSDYYVIVPPDRDAKEIMALIVAKAESLKLTVSKSKSRIVPLTKPFRYCKAKFILTETGRVVMNGNRDGVKRARRKIKAFRTKIQNGEMSYDDLWTSVNGMLAYFESYDDHNRVLRLRRLFYSVFGFSPERIENFRERGKKDEICCA